MKQETMSETTDTTETAEVTESTEPVEKSTKSINFEFYIRKICNKLKGSNDTYSKIKVSDKYQKFCSSIILDFLDQVAPLSKIVLEVMTTKTITDLVFQTIIKVQLWGSPSYDAILSELEKRLASTTKVAA
jgi:dihydroorotase